MLSSNRGLLCVRAAKPTPTRAARAGLGGLLLPAYPLLDPPFQLLQVVRSQNWSFFNYLAAFAAPGFYGWKAESN